MPDSSVPRVTSPGLAAQMRTLLDPATRRRLGANARRAVLPLSPAAITLQLVLLYRDLLAATVTAKAAARGKRGAQIAAEAPSPASATETAPPDAAPVAQHEGAIPVDARPVPDTSAVPAATDPPEAPTPPPAAAASDASRPR